MSRILIATSALIAILGLSRCDCVGSSNPDDGDAASDAAQVDGGSVDGALVDSGPSMPDVVPRTPFSAAELQLIAQRPAEPDVQVFVDEQGALAGMVGRLAANDLSADTPELAAQTFVIDLGTRALGWTQPTRDLALLKPYFAPVPVSKTTDHGQINLYTVHFMQIHRGLPIEGRSASVLIARHEGEDGLIPGSYFGNLAPERSGFADPAPVPTVDFETAFSGIIDDPTLTNFHLRGPTGGFAPHRGRLVWHENGALKLAWRILAHGSEALDRVSLLIDAETGALLDWFQYAPTAYEDSTTTASGQLATWTLPSPRTATFLKHDTLETYALAAHVAPGRRALVKVGDCNNTRFIGVLVERGTPAFNDSSFMPIRYGGDAWLHALAVLDYYRTTFGWVSWDGAGSELALYVNYRNETSSQSWNAYGGAGEIWMPGGLMTGFDKPGGAGLSIIAHEFMHSVLDATVPFTYWDESGAINEAIADLSGQMVRRWSTDLVGNECTPSGTEGLRDMMDPPRYWQPDRFGDYVNTSGDNGGVHTNSGIVNKAWALMVHGSIGAPFNGYEVVPLAANVGQASDILGRLVFSALESRYFTVDSTLRSFGTRLWAWCRTQEALFAGYGTSASAACGTVHDALAATELLHSSSPPAATNLTIDVTRGQVEQWGEGRLATVYYRVRNAGTARFNGRVYVEHVSAHGGLQYNQRDDILDLQPGASSDEIYIYGDLRDQTEDMPAPKSVLHLWLENPGLDTVAVDNVATISWRTFAYPAGGDQPLADASGAITVRLAQRGWWELQNRDIQARLLYRRAGAEDFVDVSATIEHPEPDWKSLPQVDSGGFLVNMVARPASPLTLTQRQIGGFANMAFGRPFAKASFGDDGNGHLVVHDSAHTPVDGPLLLLVLNAGQAMRTHPGLPYVFCLNCNGVRGGDYAILGFDKDLDLSGHFPADLLPMLEKLVPLSPPPSLQVSYYEMDFYRWLAFGDPIDQIGHEVEQLNAGP